MSRSDLHAQGRAELRLLAQRVERLGQDLHGQDKGTPVAMADALEFAGLVLNEYAQRLDLFLRNALG